MGLPFYYALIHSGSLFSFHASFPPHSHSSEESRASSGLSMRSSAGVRSAESPARGSDVGSGLNIEPLDISLLGQERDSKGEELAAITDHRFQNFLRL